MEVVHSPAPSVPYSWVEFLFDRSVSCLVLLSMSIQLILVLGGTIRYRTGSPLLNFGIWISYMGAYFVATAALGTMTYYSTIEVYAIWAPVLMVHLGGPDTITAYSVPDSDLWRRHCFGVLYQGLITAYVVYAFVVQDSRKTGWNLLGAASLIFIVGIVKYAERTWALWLASPSRILTSVQPIHNYMKIEHALGLEIDEGIPDDEVADVDIFREQHEDEAVVDSMHYQYIVTGEECFHENDDKGEWAESIVTIKDVWEHEEEKVTDNYLLCVSHALFKMYKRRFVSLRFHEAALKKTRRFFNEKRFEGNKVFNIVEIELKFIYDYLFSKSSGTAFSGWGVGMRVVNISLLGLSWFLIVRALQETEDVQRIVTYILMSVALGLEVFQLVRIILSDWSMVWLTCANIRQSRKLSERWWWGSCTAKVVGRVRQAMGGKYWQNQIPQLCVIETCFSARSYSYPFVRRVFGSSPFSDSCIMRGYIRAVTAWHTKRELVDDDLINLKNCVLKELNENEALNARHWLSAIKESLVAKGEGADLDLLDLITACHLGTTICYKLEDQSKIEDKNVNFAVRMSRYFAYLLVTCPEILPVHAENAKELCSEVFLEIMGKMDESDNVDDFYKKFKDSDWDRIPALRTAKRLVTKQLQETSVKRWKNWAKDWLWVLGLCATYDKCGEHAERVTVGGEFLSLVWVLLGHMGMAEESHSATAMTRDPRQWQ